jgi:hypothetical protein
MLGRLEMDVDECISAFNDLVLSYFNNKSSLLSDGSGLAGGKGRNRIALAQLARLEAAIMELITGREISVSERLNDGSAHNCKV